MATSGSKSSSKESLPRKDSNIIVSIHHEDGDEVVLALKVRGLKPKGQPMRFFIKLSKPDNPQSLMAASADLRKWELTPISLYLKVAIRKDNLKKANKAAYDDPPKDAAAVAAKDDQGAAAAAATVRQNSGGPNDMTSKLVPVLQTTSKESTPPAASSSSPAQQPSNAELYELEIRQWPCQIDVEASRFDVVQPRNRDYSFIILKLKKKDASVSWKQFQADNGCLDVSLI